MDVADELVDMIDSLVDEQKQCGRKLDKVADELEESNKGCNVAKVTGSSMSVGGAVALAAAGVFSIFTAGAAIPVLAATGAAASGVGLAANVVTDVVDLIASSVNMKDAEKIAAKINNLEDGIHKLMERLKKEGQKRENLVKSSGCSSEEDYVTEMIMRALARREGLKLNEGVSLRFIMSALSKNRIDEKVKDFAILGLSLIYKLAMIVARKSGKSLASIGFPELAKTIGKKAAGKAVGRIGAGAIGLAFSIPELISSCKKLDSRQTEASKNMRENAKQIWKASEEMENPLKEIRKMFRKLAKVLRSIEKSERSGDDKKTLIEFAKENCKDEGVLEWLRENEESNIFSKLVDMFHFLKKKVEEEEKNDHDNNIDITLVAHGAIGDSMISASCLLPLPTITDVVLYSPWNCYITADAAYGAATGKIQPRDRQFYCSEDDCKVPDKDHQPSRLPDEWNSMKKAGNTKIPNISLSPLKVPKDGAWERVVFLENKHGKPGRNRIVIPLILPFIVHGESIPFSMVSLALSLVLMFSRFQATLHLIACLGKRSRREKLDEDALKQQYACAIDYTGMTVTKTMLEESRLYNAFKVLFDSKIQGSSSWHSFFCSQQ